MLKGIFKIAIWFVSLLILVVVVLMVYVRIVSRTDPPKPASLAILDATVNQIDTGLFTIGNNWFRKSESGLYELYVEGEPFERGAANGKLTRALIEHQEEVFTEQ